MESTKEQVLTFLDKCEELKKSKFIMATTKIKDILKCIVNSPELYRLFETVTADFNYPEACKQCLVTSDEGMFKRSYVVLPRTIGKRLAFIFCLLVEFDRDSLNFNDFLRQYFPEDGSYFASFRSFCGTIISSLEDMIRQVFEEQLSQPDAFGSDTANAVESSQLSSLTAAFSVAVDREKDFVSRTSISGDDKENGLLILDLLLKAVQSGDKSLINALVCGYNYFALYNCCVDEGLEELLDILGEIEKYI